MLLRLHCLCSPFPEATSHLVAVGAIQAKIFDNGPREQFENVVAIAVPADVILSLLPESAQKFLPGTVIVVGRPVDYKSPCMMTVPFQVLFDPIRCIVPPAVEM